MLSWHVDQIFKRWLKFFMNHAHFHLQVIWRLVILNWAQRLNFFHFIQLSIFSLNFCHDFLNIFQNRLQFSISQAEFSYTIYWKIPNIELSYNFQFYQIFEFWDVFLFKILVITPIAFLWWLQFSRNWLDFDIRSLAHTVLHKI